MRYRYVEELYGHIGQIQPSHIVITSPWFDTREVPGSRGIRQRVKAMPEWKIERIAAIKKMRDDGMEWKDIAVMLNRNTQHLQQWYAEYKDKRNGSV
jgi:hypothetical protein